MEEMPLLVHPAPEMNGVAAYPSGPDSALLRMMRRPRSVLSARLLAEFPEAGSIEDHLLAHDQPGPFLAQRAVSSLVQKVGARMASAQTHAVGSIAAEHEVAPALWWCGTLFSAAPCIEERSARSAHLPRQDSTRINQSRRGDLLR